jgi:CubicO group peptidase (beta-lactamase class C family)
MKQTRALVVALCLFSGFFSSFVGAQTDPIDAYIKAEMEKRRIPGLALTVIQHGAVIKMQGIMAWPMSNLMCP